VGCLYCGKEIGAFRLFRDSEFCSSEHRKNYGQRLVTALGKMATPEPAPAGVAKFRILMPMQEGARQFIHSVGNLPHGGGSAIGSNVSWEVRVTPVLGAQALAGSGLPRFAERIHGTRVEIGQLDRRGPNLDTCAMLLPNPILGQGLPKCGDTPKTSIYLVAREAGPAGLRSFVEWLRGQPGRKLPRLALEIQKDVVKDAAPVMAGPAVSRTWAIQGNLAPVMAAPAPAARAPMPWRIAPPSPALPARPAAVRFAPVESATRSVLHLVAQQSIRTILPAALPAVENLPGVCAGWVPGLQAEAAVVDVVPAMASQYAAQPQALRQPVLDFQVVAESVELIPEACEQWMPSLPAEAVAVDVIPAMASQHAAQAQALRRPVFDLAVAAESVELIPEACEQWMPSLPAEAVAVDVVPAMASQRAAQAQALRRPVFDLTVTAEFVEQIPPACEQWRRNLPAEAAVRDVIPAMRHDHIAAMRLPRLELAAAEDRIAFSEQPWVGAPQADVVVVDVVPAMASGCAAQARALRLPVLDLPVVVERLAQTAPVGEECAPVCEEWMSGSQADLAVRDVLPMMSDEWAAAARMPQFELARAEDQPMPCEAWMPGLEADAAVRDVLPVMASECGMAARTLHVPVLDFSEMLPAAQTPAPYHQFLASPQADGAERVVMASSAAWHSVERPLCTPALEFSFTTYVPSSEKRMRAAIAQAVLVSVSPQCRMAPLGLLRKPSLAGLRAIADANYPAALAGPVAPPAEMPAESRPSIASLASDAKPFDPSLQLPALTLAESVEFGTSGFDVPEMAEAGAAARTANGVDSSTPMAAFMAMDLYGAHVASGPAERLEWASSQPTLALPGLSLRLAADRKEEATEDRLPFPASFKVLRMKVSANMGIAAKIAACLLVATSLWFGSWALHDMRSNAASASRALQAVQEKSAGSGVTTLAAAEAAASAEQSRATGPLASIRRAIAHRAALEVSDRFEGGMQAWGAAPQALAKGWTRDTAGYVRPGEMALFHPSLTYSDYKLEFFGQIENKSMDWMVRARDSQNYYAMKFAVVEPGLRPIIAMVHYPVLGGKQGHRIEVPLNVMVHQNTPYHVAVEVRGNHISTSIEGQEVDSWSDDALASGGVGFFSEAGERARLYWMKVSKNQDLLGRICSYLAGPSSGSDTAEMWGPEPPAGPRPTAPLPREEAALAVAALNGGGPFRARTGRGRSSNTEREKSWS